MFLGPPIATPLVRVLQDLLTADASGNTPLLAHVGLEGLEPKSKDEGCLVISMGSKAVSFLERVAGVTCHS